MTGNEFHLSIFVDHFHDALLARVGVAESEELPLVVESILLQVPNEFFVFQLSLLGQLLPFSKHQLRLFDLPLLLKDVSSQPFLLWVVYLMFILLQL